MSEFTIVEVGIDYLVIYQSSTDELLRIPFNGQKEMREIIVKYNLKNFMHRIQKSS